MIRTLLLLATLLLTTFAHAGGTFQGRVVAILDGDTLTVLVDGHDQKRVRLLGIDAPEKAQPFGTRSREGLAACAFGKTVTVEWGQTDRYGRILGKVLAGDEDCNLRQVSAGLAWHYKQYARTQPGQDAARYAKAEEEARSQRKGLWADQNPTPPWDWRHAGNGADGTARKTSFESAAPATRGKITGWTSAPWYIRMPLLLAAGLFVMAGTGWLVDRTWRRAWRRRRAAKALAEAAQVRA